MQKATLQLHWDLSYVMIKITSLIWYESCFKLNIVNRSMSPALRQHLYSSRKQLPSDILFSCQHLACDAVFELRLSLVILSTHRLIFLCLLILIFSVAPNVRRVLGEPCLKKRGNLVGSFREFNLCRCEEK